MSAPTAPAGSRHDAYRRGLCVHCRTAPRGYGQGDALCANCHARRPDGPHEAYRRGLCANCLTAPTSAGRPHCTTCHAALTRPGGR